MLSIEVPVLLRVIPIWRLECESNRSYVTALAREAQFFFNLALACVSAISDVAAVASSEAELERDFDPSAHALHVQGYMVRRLKQDARCRGIGLPSGGLTLGIRA